MYGDFSRLRIGEAHDFAAVWSQQGRVQLDSDLNALMQVVLDHLRTLTVDVLGPLATGWLPDAFRISLCEDPDDLDVGAGDYYVHGLRCRNEPVPGRTHGRRMREHAGPRGTPRLPDPPYLVELVVWEETVSALRAPELLEPALGPNPSDTTLRTAVRHRLRTVDRPPGDDQPVAADADAREIAQLYDYVQRHAYGDNSSRGQLAARAHTPELPEVDDDDLPTEGGFRGPENQLYRVEIHRGGRAGEATYQWSRDNGSVVFAIHGPERSQSDDYSMVVRLDAPARDRVADLEEGDWVELVTDDRFPLDEPQPLLQVTHYDRGRRQVTLAGPDRASRPTTTDASQHPFLRRWDQRGDVDPVDNAPVVPTVDDPRLSGGFLELEDGVQVMFADPDAVYRRGDYWLIPARATTGGVLWPTSPSGRPLPVYASRPLVFHAPLALVLPGRAEPVDLRGSELLRLVDPGTQGVVVPSDTSATMGVPVSSSVQVIAERPLRLVLEVLEYESEGDNPDKAGKRLGPLGPGPHDVGRSVVGNDAMLTDAQVSRKHARITVDADGVTLQDAGTLPQHDPSSLGTFVRRDDEWQQVTDATPLYDGDEVRFGPVPLRVRFQ